MNDASQQLIRAVRGTRSQAAFARRLGYRGNPVASWESGRRTPSALEFLTACERVDIDVIGAFSKFHPSTPPRSPSDLHQWIGALRANTTMAHLAERTGHSRYTISRWLSGASSPRLNHFLDLVEVLTGRVCDLVGELVPIEKVPALADANRARQAARSLAQEEPWTEAILRVIESRDCRQGDIAQQLSISPQEEARCIEKLVTAGIVRITDGQYHVTGELTVDTRAVPNLKTHWAQTALRRVAQPGDDDLFSYNVFSASEDDVAEIRELLLATYRQIRTIVANSPHPEKVALINLQMLHWPQRP